jgi:uncharacterized cupredoxin-like copper-binding protein
MLRPRPTRPLVLAIGVLLTLVLSGCAVTVRGSATGPFRHHRMGREAATCATSAPTTGTTVRVVLMDMGGHGGRPGMMSGWMAGAGWSARSRAMHGRMLLVAVPHVVSAGQVTFVAVNRGWRLHELVVLPLGSHTPIGRRSVGADRAVDERGALGEASRSCGADTGEGIRPGSTGWTTLRLTPGRYELVCNRPGHYAHGMYAELVVVP